MSRVIALVVAAGLVVAAVFVRNAIDDDGGGGPSNPEGFPTTRLVCAEELRDACERLGFGPSVDVTIEDAAATAARLAGAVPVESGIDVWAVPDPWPAIVDDTRARSGLEPIFSDRGPAVARSPFAAVGPETLESCTWRCLGDRAAADLALGGRPLSGGLGTLTLGAAAAGWFGNPDFAANDLDGEVRTWLTGFAGGLTVADQPVTRLLQSRAFFDVALSFEAEAAAAFDAASADRRAGLALLYPQPVAYLEVLVVDVDGALDDFARGLPSSIGDALIDSGWQVPADGGSGLPKPGVLVALQEVVR